MAKDPYDAMADWQVSLATIIFRWFPFAAQALAMLVAVAAVVWTVRGSLHPIWAVLLKLAIGLIVAWGLWWFAIFSRGICQDFYAEFYSMREQRLRVKDTRGFFLFLRSFKDDEFAVRSTSTIAPGNEGRTTIVAYENLSEILERGLAKYGRIIMIGSEPSADPFRDPSIMLDSDDADWWAVFCRLIENARGVFIVPERSIGLRREIRYILGSPHRTKAVVVMQRADRDGERARRWQAVRNELQAQGLELPDYDPAGCLYLPDASLRPEAIFRFDERLPLFKALSRAFRDIDSRLGPGKVSLKEALTWVPQSRGQFPASFGA